MRPHPPAGPPPEGQIETSSEHVEEQHAASESVVGMEEFNPEDQDPEPLYTPPLRRVLLVLSILGVLAAMLFVPPLVSMNRYRRQIASSISASLGRPVRIDSVTLNLLPMPGFTLKNFIVGEDPAFGSEPVLRANSVKATLRVTSLWRRRVEFSRISLDSPSVNVVHLPDGRWNLASILLQASRVKSAPTAQRAAGATPRFPYIEATGARLNIKMGLQKMPISLTEATFALWLPQPDQWQLRIEARPARTDTAATDTGTLQVEGSLGRAHRLEDVPLNLNVSWNNAPLGAASWVLLGRDLGARGDLFLHANVTGIVGENTVATELQLNNLRRADFVTEHPLTVDLRCGTHAFALFHRLEQIRCEWPVSDEGTGLVVTADVPDVAHLGTAQAHATFKSVPANGLLNVLKAVSPRVSRDLQAAGVAYGDLRYEKATVEPLANPHKPASRQSPKTEINSLDHSFSGTFGMTHASLTLDGGTPFLQSEIVGTLTGERLEIAPFPVELGGQTPAMFSGHADRQGYSLHLTGSVLRSRLAQLAQSLPQFGDGLPLALVAPADPSEARAPESSLRVNLDSTRTWHGSQTWASTAPEKPAAHKHSDAVTSHRDVRSTASTD